MKRTLTTLALLTAAAGSGCGADSTGLYIQGSKAPGGGAGVCMFQSGGANLFQTIVDTAVTFRKVLVLDVKNNLQTGMININGRMGNPSNFMLPNDVTPLRFDLRWECDSTGFMSDVGALVLPAFHPTKPFCLDRRADVKKEFIGFDTVVADGPPIVAGGGNGIVVITPVSFQMGQAVDDLWRIAALADDCCTQTKLSNCDGQSTTGACAVLEDIFTALDPMKSNLSVKATANTQSKDLVRFRGFAIFDGNHALKVDPNRYGVLEYGARYPMRMRGVLEGVTRDGTTVTSGEYTTLIDFCKNCGLLPPTAGVGTMGGLTRPTAATYRPPAVFGQDCLN